MAYYYSPFRKKYIKNSRTEKTCVFCAKEIIEKQAVRDSDNQIIQSAHYYWLVNYHPKFEGHTIIVPKRHLISLHEESPEEVLARESLIKFAANILQRLYPNSGIEIFLQYGEGSASSVSHIHWHVVPASPNDPLRSFEKLGQFYTVDENTEKVLLFPIRIEKAKHDLQRALSKIINTATYHQYQ